MAGHARTLEAICVRLDERDGVSSHRGFVRIADGRKMSVQQTEHVRARFHYSTRHRHLNSSSIAPPKQTSDAADGSGTLIIVADNPVVSALKLLPPLPTRKSITVPAPAEKT